MAVLKIAHFWPFSKRPSRGAALAVADDSLGLDAFGSESSLNDVDGPRFPVSATARTRTATRRSTKAWTTIAVGVLVLAAAGLGAYEYRRHPLPWASSTAVVAFETIPSGIEIFVSQKSVGRSPLTISLPPGRYDVRLGTGTAARTTTLSVTAGTSTVQHFELAPAATAVPPATTGALRIQTEPDGLPISLDDVGQGVSPITVEGLSPGGHDILVGGRSTPLRRAVKIVAGETASVFISAAGPAPDPGLVAVGWLSFRSPVTLQVKEGGRLLGSTDVDRLMLPSGSHDLELTNDQFGYQSTRRVTIAAGKTTMSAIVMPTGTVNLNAVPWADVFVDGKSLGQTPIGNLSLTIGPHAVVFRHPALGERKETVNVTTRSTARLGVDLREK